jgi:hypothetical protein
LPGRLSGDDTKVLVFTGLLQDEKQAGIKMNNDGIFFILMVYGLII